MASMPIYLPFSVDQGWQLRCVLNGYEQEQEQDPDCKRTMSCSELPEIER